MTNLKGKRVLIFQQRGWGVRLGHYLAKKLQAEGCLLAALTFKKSTHRFIAGEQKEVRYELIINDDEVAADPRAYLGESRPTLAEACENLGIDSVWPFVVTLKHYARSYGDKYYYSFRQSVSDEQIEDYILAVYKYLKIFFDEFKPDVVVAPVFGDMRHIMCNLMCEQRGVKMLALTDSKVRGLFVTTYGYRNDRGPFYDLVASLNRGDAASSSSERARQYIREFRDKFKQADYMEKVFRPKSFFAKALDELRPWRDIWQWFTDRPINEVPALGITPDFRPPRVVLRDHFARKRNQHLANRFPYHPLKKLGNFAYFPLQVQPEATIDVMAPYFNNQIEVARQAAISLPGGMTLAVKEHPAMVGKRSFSYYEKLALLPNVKLIDYRLQNEDVLRKTAVVISPSSTTISEAAFFRKPAVQLGDLGTTQLLPNVFRHTDMTTLAGKIKELLSLSFHTVEYEQKLENFVAAAYDTGLPVSTLSIWDRGDEESKEKIWQYYRQEIERVIK